jgi:hypothetical protein
MFPHESGIVMQRGIEMGMVFSSALIAHCFYVMQGHNRRNSPHPFLDLFLEFSLLLRVICAIPRPYIWLNTWRKFVRARSQPTPQMVTRELMGIYNNQNRLERFLLHFYYGWLLVTSLVTLFSPYRTEFCQHVWQHLLLNFAFIVLHRIICIVIFYYLVNSDIARGLHPTVLDNESTVIKFSSTETQSIRSDCSICYGDYSINEEIRILKCSHDYHKGCIDEWLIKHRNRCPMCLHVVGTVLVR